MHRMMGKLRNTEFVLAGGFLAALLAFARMCASVMLRSEASAYTECSMLGVLRGQWSLCHWLAMHGSVTILRLVNCSLRSRRALWLSPNSAAAKAKWTPVHCAATQGHAASVGILLENRQYLDEKDANGHTALAMATSQGHVSVAQQLIRASAQVNSVDGRMITPLHIAASRGHTEMALLLLDSGSNLDVRDSGGWTPLLAACAHGSQQQVLKLLLERGACANVSTFGKELTPLRLVANWTLNGAEMVSKLLRFRANPAATDKFGQTVLHIACRQGRVDLVKALSDGGAPQFAQDNDGHFPVQFLCHCCAERPDDRELVETGLAAILRADGGVVEKLDFSDASPLHTLLHLATIEKTAPVYALRALLAAAADPTCEDESGFTAVHYAVAAGHGGKDMVSTLWDSALATPAFWTGLDLDRKRDTSNSKYLSRRGDHHRIPKEMREDVLRGKISLHGVAQRLLEGRSCRVVALIGAGASTAAGIPDFRSPLGLWSQPATRELFSLEGFLAQPEAFWQRTSELFMGRKPTKVHKFLARLAREGMLQRVYTQNIDGLEEAAGVPSDLVVQCHGSALRTVCSTDSRHVPQRVSIEIASELSSAASHTWWAPRCACGSLLRPDIVFFGEPLPANFELLSGEDMHACDMLLVIGTSLSVFPVAGLVSRVSMLTPRALVNHEAVGAWRDSGSRSDNYRDVLWEGDCQNGVEALAGFMGWDLGNGLHQ